MKIITKEEFLGNLDFYLREIGIGKIFVYGTDTIYGIGCDAMNNKAVSKIRKVKMRDKKPFSIISPSEAWILENCIIDNNAKAWLDKLPGPYTLILKLKNQEAVSNKVNLGLNSLGVRIPAHWFSKIVEKYGKPFVTTSVNLTGEPFIKRIEDITGDMKDKIDYAIDEGIIDSNPSTIVKLINGTEEIVRR